MYTMVPEHPSSHIEETINPIFGILGELFFFSARHFEAEERNVHDGT